MQALVIGNCAVDFTLRVSRLPRVTPATQEPWVHWLVHRIPAMPRLRTLEDLVYEACESEIKVRIVHRVGYQPQPRRTWAPPMPGGEQVG
jgi:hypothetical protein